MPRAGLGLVRSALALPGVRRGGYPGRCRRMAEFTA